MTHHEREDPKSLRDHYGDVIMGAIASQITSLTIVYSTVYSDTDQIKHQSAASLAFLRGIHRGTVEFPAKWPVTGNFFPFDDVIRIHGFLSEWFSLQLTVPCLPNPAPVTVISYAGTGIQPQKCVRSSSMGDVEETPTISKLNSNAMRHVDQKVSVKIFLYNYQFILTLREYYENILAHLPIYSQAKRVGMISLLADCDLIQIFKFHPNQKQHRYGPMSICWYCAHYLSGIGMPNASRYFYQKFVHWKTPLRLISIEVTIPFKSLWYCDAI